MSNLLNKIFRREKEIIRQDRKDEFINLLFESQKRYPQKREDQIKYIKENGKSQDELLGMLTLVQMEYAINSMSNKKIEISPLCLEYMLRGFLDTARHMQDELPEGVYSYINSNIDTFMNEILRQIEEP